MNHVLGINPDTAKAVIKKSRKHKPKGTCNSMVKLTEADILEIRSLADTITGIELARRYNVSQPHMCNIINRKKWGHI